jgi:hypothetical protein
MGKYIDSSKAYRDYLIYMEQQMEDTPKLDSMEDTPKLDSIVTSIIDQFTARAKMGKEKYGVDLDRTDLSLMDWLEHAKQEHMDAILYLEKIKQIIIGQEKAF